jgi:flagellar protein FlbD
MGAEARSAMIEVTKLNGEKFVINADHIESVESHPDTTLVLTNGKRFVVAEKVEEVVRRAVEYQRLTRSGIPRSGSGSQQD